MLRTTPLNKYEILAMLVEGEAEGSSLFLGNTHCVAFKGAFAVASDLDSLEAAGVITSRKQEVSRGLMGADVPPRLYYKLTVKGIDLMTSMPNTDDM